MADDVGDWKWSWQSVPVSAAAPTASGPLLSSAGQTDATTEPPIPQQGQQPLPQAIPGAEPVETEPVPVTTAAAPSALDVAAQRGAGVGILLVSAGVGAGWLLGGAWGAGAGLLLVGAARNGWRAKELWPSTVPTDREEAAKSATMAVVGGIIGGYLAYRAVSERE